MTDYYNILGVERQASQDDIKQAYRRLASKHHPDKGGDVKKFQEIEEAYRILGNADSRAQYDNPARPFNFQDFGQQGNPHFNFNDIFEMFGTRFGHGQQQQQRRATARMTLWLPLKDVALGGKRVIAVSSPAGQSNIEIDIPQGIDDGDNVRYPGLAPGGMDLMITFRIQPDAEWRREGHTVVHEKTVSIWDLILGTKLKITTLNQTEIEITIPPMTQPGTTLRCRGHGLRSRTHPTPGDLMIVLRAQLPTDIPDELKEHIRKHRDQ